MRAATKLCVLAIALGASACEGGGSGAPSTSELEAYCAVARRDDLSTWVRDVVTLCAGTVETVTCRAARVRGGGTIDAIELGDLAPTRVLPASGGRFVVLLADDRLVLAGANGSVERELAPWASDPWISDDGERVAWIGLDEGVLEWDFGAATVVAAQDLSEPSRAILARDELAGAPRPIPGSRDVLYVSAQTGLASFWIAGPDRSPVQLTNVGLVDIDQARTPVADRELAWGPDGSFYYGVPSAEDGPGVWRFSIGGGARALGPGSWPRLHDGAVLAIWRGADACAAVYANGGTP